MNWNDIVTALLIIAGGFFFLAGTVGLLRLPDVFTRLHALTKADNLGLGLITLGAAFQIDNPLQLVKLGLIWALVMVASATVAHLIGRSALQQGQQPWEKGS
jgi:multicomponent Na+:H+ antiporter subunit G